MKKIIATSLILLVISFSVSAQLTPRNRVQRPRISVQVTRAERFELMKDRFRFEMAQRLARRDGYLSPQERNRLQKMKRQQRRELFIYKHNRNRRVI